MTTTWELSDSKASFSSNDWKIQLEPAQPSSGMLARCSDPKTGWRIGSVVPLPQHSQIAEEVYVRQNDLISRFSQGPTDSFGFQVQHRILPTSTSTELVGLETWLSVQTQLLDASPILLFEAAPEPPKPAVLWKFHTHSELVEKRSLPDYGPAAIVCNSQECTAVWLIETTDQPHFDVKSAASDSTQRIEIFGHFMEKGVIRRARLRFHILGGNSVQLQTIQDLYAAFCESPLPLTA